MPERLPVLDVRCVSVHRAGTTLLNRVSWRVASREHWVILGANGSGKTSLLSALTGYLTPTRGEIFLLGREYGRADWRDLRKEIGLVSSSIRQLMADDEPALEAVVSGRYAMIDLWGRLRAQDRTQGMRVLRRIECRHLADRPWGCLSQGERQRVLIGRALMANPQVLLLDEPCAGLDPVARERFLQWLNRLGRQRSGPSLILVTHHVEEIMPAFNKALLLKRGRVVASGAKSSVLRHDVLSRAFNANLRVRQVRGRYSLSVEPSRSLIC